MALLCMWVALRSYDAFCVLRVMTAGLRESNTQGGGTKEMDKQPSRDLGWQRRGVVLAPAPTAYPSSARGAATENTKSEKKIKVLVQCGAHADAYMRGRLGLH